MSMNAISSLSSHQQRKQAQAERQGPPPPSRRFDVEHTGRMAGEIPSAGKLEQGGIIAQITFGVLVIMSIGSWYIFFVKLIEQHKMVHAALDGRIDEARELHFRLLPAMRACFLETNPIPVKAALTMLGRPAGVPRLPLVPATTEEQDRVRAALEDAGLL